MLTELQCWYRGVVRYCKQLTCESNYSTQTHTHSLLLSAHPVLGLNERLEVVSDRAGMIGNLKV
jgi:hypothetical protein